MNKEKYLIKARKLNKAGFAMFGYGNFDLSLKEISLILEYIEKDNFVSIKKLYKRLEKERL